MLDSQEPIDAVLVREGQQVKVGDVLVKQDAARVNAQLHQAQARVEVSRAYLQQAIDGPRPQEITQARARLEATVSLQSVQRGEWQRAKSLAASSFSATQDVDILKGRYDAATADVRQTKAALDLLLAGTRQEEITVLQSHLLESQARLADIEISQQRLSLIAPLSGIVDAVNVEVGERPMPGEIALVLLDTQRAYARVHIPAPMRVGLQLGAVASIKIEGIDLPLKGQLRWIASDASFTPFYALTQRDRSYLAFLAEVDVILPFNPGSDSAGRDLSIPFGVPVEVRFPEAML
jgi:HlyD family secretion protein